ncbi:MAG: RNA-binding protein [Nanoarchaeota archaeon]|nr:RNA-binding protein [Nanoarchaeota archaeon]
MKIYVGNLPFSVEESDLKELFSGYEPEEVVLIKDKFNGRSKGFGFVTIPNDEVAQRALSELNGKDFKGRELKLSEAKPFDPDAPRPRRDFNRGPRSGGFGGQRRSFGGGRDGGRRERF